MHTDPDLLLADDRQSAGIDRQTMELLQMAGDTLMELAGNAAADAIAQNLPEEASVLVLCGKGNNAGDALVVARILADRGSRVAVYPVFGLDDLSDDARGNLHRLHRVSNAARHSVVFLQELVVPDGCDLIVDGIFGTGLHREVAGRAKAAIEFINTSGLPVCALDVPSGLDAASGQIHGICVKASQTLQFGLRKLGCYIEHGPAVAGERSRVPLPFPGSLLQPLQRRLVNHKLNPSAVLAGTLTPSSLRAPSIRQGLSGVEIPSTRQPRSTTGAAPTLHKYNNGVVHVIGGSRGLTGAPVYTAKAAWGAGMGAVTLMHPAAWLGVMDTLAPEMVKLPCGTDDAWLSMAHTEDILEFLRHKPGVMVLGPGMGRNEQSLECVRRVLRDADVPAIVDADALHALDLTAAQRIMQHRKAPVIVTPHAGELAAMTGMAVNNDARRLEAATRWAQLTGCTVLAKGNPCFICPAGGEVLLVTDYDTRGFARAGFGDVLAGHLAAFLNRTGDATLSCELALLHGYRKLCRFKESEPLCFPEPSTLV